MHNLLTLLATVLAMTDVMYSCLLSAVNEPHCLPT